MCSDVVSFPQIYLHIQGHFLHMLPKDYFVKHEEVCYLGFQRNPGDYWLLGDNFYRGFYMIHDDANGRIGIAPHSTSNKDKVQASELPNTLLPSVGGHSVYQKIEFLVIALLLLFILMHWVLPKVKEWFSNGKKNNHLATEKVTLVLIKWLQRENFEL